MGLFFEADGGEVEEGFLDTDGGGGDGFLDRGGSLSADDGVVEGLLVTARGGDGRGFFDLTEDLMGLLFEAGGAEVAEGLLEAEVAEGLLDAAGGGSSLDADRVGAGLFDLAGDFVGLCFTTGDFEGLLVTAGCLKDPLAGCDVAFDDGAGGGTSFDGDGGGLLDAAGGDTFDGDNAGLFFTAGGGGTSFDAVVGAGLSETAGILETACDGGDGLLGAPGGEAARGGDGVPGVRLEAAGGCLVVGVDTLDTAGGGTGEGEGEGSLLGGAAECSAIVTAGVEGVTATDPAPGAWG